MTPAGRRMPAASGLVIVDKPAGQTSHDVVAQIRRLAGTRRVGHAGTLDPMATGVLVIGVEKATRLLGYLALTGEIQQVPPGFSAIKVSGKRAYRLAREGAAPELAARTVTVSSFTVLAVRRRGGLLDADVAVTCSSGTYIRALARDLGAALGVGGHLTALRRIRVGPYRIGQARTLEQLAASFTVIGLAEAAGVAFRRLNLTEEDARLVAHGRRLPAAVLGDEPGPVAAFAPDGSLIALLTQEAGQARPLAVFAP